jgi:hypothetical protein
MAARLRVMKNAWKVVLVGAAWAVFAGGAGVAAASAAGEGCAGSGSTSPLIA